jgi:hypothetical protein
MCTNLTSSSFDVVFWFLQHLISPLPLNYFSTILFLGTGDTSFSLSSFLTIIQPHKEPTLQQPLLIQMDELATLTVIKCSTSVLQELAEICMNKHVQLDLSHFREIPNDFMEEANTIF